MNQNRIAIIGSGPSAFSALKALQEKGESIDIIDAGLTEVDGNFNKSKRKTANGNDFPYLNFNSKQEVYGKKIDFINSFAMGGLSNVWGATIHPNLTSETFQKNGLAKYLPITKTSDIVKNKLNYPEQVHDRNGNLIYIYDSTCLVENKNTKCRLCSMCLSGCPYELIWNSATSFKSLGNSNQVNYFSKFRCFELQMHNHGVTVLAKNQANEDSKFGPYKKVLLATGPLETFRILNSSKIINTKKANLEQTDTFYILVKNHGETKFDSGFGLAQLHLEIFGDQKIWIQLSAFSKSHVQFLKNKFKLLNIFADSFLKYVLRNYCLGIGYVDSNSSAGISFEIVKNAKIEIKSNNIPKRNLVKNILKANLDNFSKLNLKPIRSTLIRLPAGGGAHYGNLNIGGENINSYLADIGMSEFVEVIDTSSSNFVELGPITVGHMFSIFEKISRE